MYHQAKIINIDILDDIILTANLLLSQSTNAIKANSSSSLSLINYIPETILSRIATYLTTKELFFSFNNTFKFERGGVLTHFPKTTSGKWQLIDVDTSLLVARDLDNICNVRELILRHSASVDFVCEIITKFRNSLKRLAFVSGNMLFSLDERIVDEDDIDYL